MEGNLRFKIDWASLIVRSKFTVFALFYFVFEGNFPSRSPGGGSYLEGRFNGGFFALPVWGAYIWRGLFSEFYGLPGNLATWHLGDSPNQAMSDGNLPSPRLVQTEAH